MFLQLQAQQSQETQRAISRLLLALQGLGAVLGAIGMSLEGIRQSLDSLRDISRQQLEVFTTEVSVDSESPVSGGKVLEVIAKSLGVQSKTFADLNSFSAEDVDLPDIPDSIDISQIFRFLKVSDQIRRG